MPRRVASAVATIRAREAASSARFSALAIAVATSSVNSVSRSSVSSGKVRSLVEATTITPQRRSSTMTGAPAAERQSRSRARVATGPEAPS